MAYDKVVDSAFLNNGLAEIADAIRAKGGTSGNLAFPTAMAEAIAAMETGGNDDGYTLEILCRRAVPISLTGYVPGVRNVVVDMNNYSQNMPAIQYFGVGNPGGTYTVRNIVNHNAVSDLFRQACVFSEIVFEPYWAPNSLNRFCYQHNWVMTETGSDGAPPPFITIRGLRLDNLTSTSSPFYADQIKTSFNVIWEGTLSNSVSFSSALALTDESLALLLNCLADFSGTSETRTLTLGATLLGRLTDAQITAASGKGWTLA